ncbi:MAG: hypothetical protein ACP5H2_04590 [Solirubrobacteraceae bacterium]
MTTESHLTASHAGTKTYRGRTLAEILPQIREELGPDAVIIREREGLVGGVGGFFAQRVIEVEARRPDGQTIDIYDDLPQDEPQAPYESPDSTLQNQPSVHEESLAFTQEASETEQTAQAAPAPASTKAPDVTLFVPPTVGSRQAAPKLTTAHPAEKLLQSQPPPVPTTTRPTTTRPFEAGIFMERLRQASAMLPDDELDGAPPWPAVPSEPSADPLAQLGADIDAEEVIAALGAARPGKRPSASRPARNSSSRRIESSSSPRPTPRVSPGRSINGEGPARPTRSLSAAPSADPYASIRRGPAQEATPRVRRPAVRRSGPGLQEPSQQTGETPAVRVLPDRRTAQHQSALQESRDGAPAQTGSVLRQLISRLFSGRRDAARNLTTGNPLDSAAAAALSSELVLHGASTAWSQSLIGLASAHGTPLASGLREATLAQIAKGILPAAPLPAAGAAITFIGAGGSGKTLCSAALASAYRRASTLAVSVVVLDDPAGARELDAILHDEGIPVLSPAPDQLKRVIDQRRQGGLVIVDTPTVTHTDGAAVQALTVKLGRLELDAIYLTLPATLAPGVAQEAVSGLDSVRPSAIVATHTDETDRLGMIVEVAAAQHIPLAYLCSGTNHRQALAAVDPVSLARRLLP